MSSQLVDLNAASVSCNMQSQSFQVSEKLDFIFSSFSSLRWFKETQAKLLRSSSSGKFPEWFHGILSKRKAEKLLADKPQGNFLVRACENRFGYSLSVKRSDGSCLHHMISQLESTGKYVVVGEPKVYPDLSSILRSYSKVVTYVHLSNEYTCDCCN